MTIISTYDFQWLEGYEDNMKKKFPQLAQAGYQFTFTSKQNSYIATITADYTDTFCSIEIYDTSNNLVQPRLKVRENTPLWFRDNNTLFYSKTEQKFIFGSLD